MTDYKLCLSLSSTLIHQRYSYQSQPIQSSHIVKTFAFKLIFISVRFSCDICVMLPQRLHSLQNFAVCYIQHCSRKLSLIKKIVAPLLTCYQLRLVEKQKARSQILVRHYSLSQTAHLSAGAFETSGQLFSNSISQ